MAGHFIVDEDAYRSPSEVPARGSAADPLARFAAAFLLDHPEGASDLEAIGGEVEKELEAAIAFARNAPAPVPESLLTDVYAGPQRET